MFELDEQHLTPELMLVKGRVGNRLDGGVAYLSRLTDFGIRLPPNNIVEHVRKIHTTWNGNSSLMGSTKLPVSRAPEREPTHKGQGFPS